MILLDLSGGYLILFDILLSISLPIVIECFLANKVKYMDTFREVSIQITSHNRRSWADYLDTLGQGLK